MTGLPKICKKEDVFSISHLGDAALMGNLNMK
jgi:hypothetical protein